MASIVVEPLISTVVELMIGKIATEIWEFYRTRNLDESLLEKLESTLLILQAFLSDAEEKHIKNAAVKAWLDGLTQALFDADDLLDEVATEALRRKVEAHHLPHCPLAVKARKVLCYPFKRPYGEINSKMQKLVERLKSFVDEARTLPLEKGVSGNYWHSTPTNSAVDDSTICGRDKEKQNLKKCLLSEDADADSGSKIGVFAIVGMGGVGKTTLAKLLYNDAEVKEKFDAKAWVSVTKDFDVVKLTKSLIESVTSKSPKSENFDTLRGELQKNLSGKKFLLVLDDIWNARYVDWNNLMHILNVGKMGSKILVTTRHENVVAVVKAMETCHLDPLANEDCWALLSKHAFGAHKSTEISSNLEEIGKKIAEKCGGLPLAVVAIGGLLSTKLSTEHWRKVLNSSIWHLTVNDVQPSLLLSYHFLPASLKQCFAYCAIFPKKSELPKKKLVQLWMAQGFINVSQNERSMEEVGGEYFDELVARSLIQLEEDRFEMHDLINDLATMDKEMLNNFDKIDSIYELKGLRTLLALPCFDFYAESYLANEVFNELLLALKHLRVLSLSNYSNITVLPNSIGDLKHLRYLDLSSTGIKKLPLAICKLYNLQILLLTNCSSLTELPGEMEKLVNLRYLDIYGTELEEMPVGIAQLKNLQTLTQFIVSKQHNGLKLAEMRKFPNLQGKFCISKLENVIHPSDAYQANLKEKKQIQELSLEWSECDPILEDSQYLVFEHLQPSTILEELSVKCYGGISFPNWLGDSSFDNLVSLSIEDCCNCSSLPPLGQLPNLEELSISGMTSVRTIGSEFYGTNSPSFQPFPSLESLSFQSMAEWEEWKMIDGITTEFPNLSYLRLSSCPKLKGNLPTNLPCLIQLSVEDCSLLRSQTSAEVDGRNSMTPTFNLFSEFILHFNSLEELFLTEIPSLTSFPNNGLPKMLSKLFIQDCQNLEFPSHEFLSGCKALEHLMIKSSCRRLTSFPLGSLPVLKLLQLEACKNLKSVSVLEKEAASQSLKLLEYLSIERCPKLESISLHELCAPNVTFFLVTKCYKITSLPEPINSLPGLHSLYLSSLPKLLSFAKEGLPINLRALGLENVEGVYSNTDITKWGLERLTSLFHFRIRGEYMVKKLMDMVVLLPNSVEMLEIEGAAEIQHLDGKWLQHLTSLSRLSLAECDKLRSLPEEGLPSSILCLEMKGCPMLKASYQRKKGKHWPKIAHIPSIISDW
ncbi:hypothetical protein PIB30_017470 [Stylosanthes scabra]|uniref:Uncharacterized protein n=1 Tax=Stylosanthes scabra TaxID=79078 RepID=A0ABU6Z731_9FABA|nr:hypothetical protein [Stylosanthes scabra]